MMVVVVVEQSSLPAELSKRKTEKGGFGLMDPVLVVLLLLSPPRPNKSTFIYMYVPREEGGGGPLVGLAAAVVVVVVVVVMNDLTVKYFGSILGIVSQSERGTLKKATP